MGTYFHGGTEIQADGLQTLYLMNPNYVGYSDTQQTPNMLFLNSASASALNPASIAHAPPPHSHHFVGVPLPAASTAIRSPNNDDPSLHSIHFQHEISNMHNMAPRFQYNLWSSSENPTTTVETISPGVTATKTTLATAADVASQLGFLRPAQQGLSLSLSPQQPAYRPPLHAQDGITVPAPATVISPTSRGSGGEDVRGLGGSPSSVSAVSNGISGAQSVILGSKYLKAAQQLLDEVVNVGKGIKTDSADSSKEKVKISREPMAGEGSSGGGESSSKRGGELTTAQRQELQMKKAKLINMLDEVKTDSITV